MYIKTLPKLETKINKKETIKIDFSGGHITSDAGLFLLKKFDDTIKFVEDINNLIHDPRDTRKITHTQKQLMSQRLYQIIAGYEDCNDSDVLRNDPALQLIAGKENLRDSLGSQPTISRLENRVTRAQITQLKRLFVQQYINNITPHKGRAMILDCDSTEDTVHGEQQLSFFNGLFDENCYHPLLVFEADSQALLGAQLRPGNYHPARNIRRVLLPIIKELKERWPNKEIIIRGDSAFGSQKMMYFCQGIGCDYIFVLGNLHNRFDKYINKLLQKAERQYQKTQKEVILYSSFWYHSRYWKKCVRIRVQIKVAAEGTEKRFLLTNLKGSGEGLFTLYNQRARCENYIKELKLDLKADRLSCHSFKANFFRLLLHCFAYQLLVLFRYALSHIPEIAKAQAETLRTKLFKIGAIIYQRARWTWICLSSSWPFRRLFFQVAQRLKIARIFSG